MRNKILVLTVFLLSGNLCLAACPSADIAGDCLVDYEDFVVNRMELSDISLALKMPRACSGVPDLQSFLPELLCRNSQLNAANSNCCGAFLNSNSTWQNIICHRQKGYGDE